MHNKNPQSSHGEHQHTVTCVARKTMKEVEPDVKEHLKKKDERKKKKTRDYNAPFPLWATPHGANSVVAPR